MCGCLVTAWRVTRAPSVNRTIDIGPVAQSRATMPRRVGSPIASSALKILRDVERERGPQTDVLAQRRRAVVAFRRPENKRQGAVDLAMRSDRATAMDVRAMLAHRSRDS